MLRVNQATLAHTQETRTCKHASTLATLIARCLQQGLQELQHVLEATGYINNQAPDKACGNRHGKETKWQAGILPRETAQHHNTITIDHAAQQTGAVP